MAQLGNSESACSVVVTRGVVLLLLKGLCYNHMITMPAKLPAQRWRPLPPHQTP
jgi:hypothetical protein